MATTLTQKGQVTIPKAVRDALQLRPGDPVTFDVNREGQIVLLRASPAADRTHDRFSAMRGKADIKWHTDELMSLLRDV